MKKNLNIAFIHCSREQGFALPTAIGMGLVMILISATLLIRSQGDQITASDQKETARSLSLSEVGVTRTLSAFKQNSTLARTDYNSSSTTNWTTLLGGSGSSQVTSLLEDTEPNRWIPLSTFGYFKIDSYVHNDTTGIGTLIVLGKTTQGAKSSVEVEIAYKSPAITPPRLAISAWRRKEVASGV